MVLAPGSDAGGLLLLTFAVFFTATHSIRGQVSGFSFEKTLPPPLFALPVLSRSVYQRAASIRRRLTGNGRNG
jgi:hypothetical protein